MLYTFLVERCQDVFLTFHRICSVSDVSVYQAIRRHTLNLYYSFKITDHVLQVYVISDNFFLSSGTLFYATTPIAFYSGPFCVGQAAQRSLLFQSALSRGPVKAVNEGLLLVILKECARNFYVVRSNVSTYLARLRFGN